MFSRRAVLLGGAAVTGGAGIAGTGVQQGTLPGRPWVQAYLGLNGTAGTVPDAEPGPIVSGSFVSEHRLGADTGWSLIYPPDPSGGLPVVIALHGLGADHRALIGPAFGLDRFLAAAVDSGVAPFAIATVDGGTSYWHPRASGEDAGAMVTEELLPILEREGVTTQPFGLLGWSMGGYGALRLAALRGPAGVSAVVASSPAIWSDPDEASTSGFEDSEEYAEFSVVGHQADLAGMAVRIDCGTGDPFYRDVEDYVAGFPDGADVTHTFEPGAHDPAYWRRMVPAQLAFLGARLPRIVPFTAE